MALLFVTALLFAPNPCGSILPQLLFGMKSCIWMPQHLRKHCLLPICYVAVCLICWEEKLCCDPLKERHCEMHDPRVEGAVIAQLFHLLQTDILAHKASPFLFKTLWTLLLSRLCVCVHTRFSHPPCDLTLSSGFRLLKRDEFTGAVIMPCQAEMFIEGYSLYLQKHHYPLKKCPVYICLHINPFL